MTNSFNGQWVSREPVRHEDGQPTHKTINVIEYRDGFIRAIGENIPFEEFERMYVRPSEIADPSRNPFASKDALKGVDKGSVSVTKPTETTEQYVVERTINKSDTQLNSEYPKEDKRADVSEIKDLTEFNEVEKFLIKAIEISTNKSEENTFKVKNFDIDLPLRFDLKKILNTAIIMDISDESLIKVIREEFTKKETIEPIIDTIITYLLNNHNK